MTSNRLARRRAAISNPKICKSKLRPPAYVPPPPPPTWPPPYIHARILATVSGINYETTVTAYPTTDPPRIRYDGGDPYDDANVSFLLDTAASPQTLRFNNATRNASPFFYANTGQTLTLNPPSFTLQNSQWATLYPYDAAVTVIASYPDQP